MEVDTVAKARFAFYRLVGSDPDDTALTDLGEAEDDVAYLYLTLGSRAAQRWMLDMGYGGWRTRSSALAFTGSDDADGGTKVTLPTNFLRAFGNRRVSALTEPDGRRWGTQLDDEEAAGREGDYYYVRGEELWLTRRAQPPTTLYLDYHYRHPEWTSAVVIDFPLESRMLIVAEAADAAKEENWLPGGAEMERKIERALVLWRERARKIARQTKQPREFRRAVRYGNHWLLIPPLLPAMLSLPTPFALQAHAPTEARPVAIGVGLREYVPLDAVRLPAVPSRHTLSPHDILHPADRFHMNWVDASTIPAQMVYCHARWDRTDEQLIDGAMRLAVDLAGVTHPHMMQSIPVVVMPTEPAPTRRPDLDFAANAARQNRQVHLGTLVLGERSNRQFDHRGLGDSESAGQFADHLQALGGQPETRGGFSHASNVVRSAVSDK